MTTEYRRVQTKENLIDIGGMHSFTALIMYIGPHEGGFRIGMVRDGNFTQPVDKIRNGHGSGILTGARRLIKRIFIFLVC